MTGIGAAIGRFIARASAAVISLSGPYYAFGSGPFAAPASFSLTNAGLVTSTGNSNETWITPQTGMADYQARATLIFGALTSGTAGSWLSLGTTRTWSISTSAPGDLVEAQLLIEIRRVSDGAILASADVYLSA